MIFRVVYILLFTSAIRHESINGRINGRINGVEHVSLYVYELLGCLLLSTILLEYVDLAFFCFQFSIKNKNKQNKTAMNEDLRSRVSFTSNQTRRRTRQNKIKRGRSLILPLPPRVIEI